MNEKANAGHGTSDTLGAWNVILNALHPTLLEVDSKLRLRQITSFVVVVRHTQSEEAQDVVHQVQCARRCTTITATVENYA